MKRLSSLGFRVLIGGAALALAGGTALADQERTAPELPEVASEGAAAGEVDRADPIAQTLPSVASAIAIENAFGQRGAIERAARDLVRSAAADEAASAARELAAELAAEGRAIGQEARALGADNAQRGLDRADAARGADRRPDVPGGR